MSYSIEPASYFFTELTHLITKASHNLDNKWFFTDASFIPENQLEKNINTWQNENFVVIEGNKIVCYFEAKWSRPLDIISGFRLLLIDKTKQITLGKAIFDYFDYLFLIRGCKAFNWFVAEKNIHAYKIYERFIRNYFGHRVGKRSFGQKAYDGEVSDIVLYEITGKEYEDWKHNQK